MHDPKLLLLYYAFFMQTTIKILYTGINFIYNNSKHIRWHIHDSISIKMRGEIE